MKRSTGRLVAVKIGLTCYLHNILVCTDLENCPGIFNSMVGCLVHNKHVSCLGELSQQHTNSPQWVSNTKNPSSMLSHDRYYGICPKWQPCKIVLLSVVMHGRCPYPRIQLNVLICTFQSSFQHRNHKANIFLVIGRHTLFMIILTLLTSLTLLEIIVYFPYSTTYNTWE